MARKGVSPLIAAVLLIAFTMAVAAILTAWVTTFTQDTTAQVANDTEDFVECTGAILEIIAVETDAGEVSVTVSNRGSQDLMNVSATAISGGATDGAEIIGFLESGQIDSATFETESGTEPDTVRVASQNCPAVTDSTSP